MSWRAIKRGGTPSVDVGVLAGDRPSVEEFFKLLKEVPEDYSANEVAPMSANSSAVE